MDYGYCPLESYTTGTANFSYLCEIVIIITLRLGSVRSSRRVQFLNLALVLVDQGIIHAKSTRDVQDIIDRC